MITRKHTSFSLAAGAALTAGLAFSPLVSAESNPFANTELNSGYMQVAEHHGKEGKCGEAKCGGEMKDKAKEGECGGEMKNKAKEGECGGEMKTDEGKCGEAKCGGKE